MRLFLKRLMDVSAALLLLALLSPLFLVITLLVRVNLGAPVLFRQQRIGRDEKPFELLKFRTMREGAAPDAERLNRFGTLLRATSLDELPSLWNLLIGEMSLVGPRPLLPEYLPYYRAVEKIRHRVRPGITGLAQVNGRNALGWDERLAMDAAYVQGFSLMLDLKILWRTAQVVLQRDGIHAEGHATMRRLDDERRGTA